MRFPRFSLFHPSLFFLYNRVESYNLHYQSFSFSLFNCRIIKRLAFLRVKDALQVFKHSAGFLLQGFIYILRRNGARIDASSIMRRERLVLSSLIDPSSWSKVFLLGDNLRATLFSFFSFRNTFSFSLATSIHYLLLPSFFFHSFYKKIK